MAGKSYHAARPFDVGGIEVTHYEAGDSVPADSPHLEQLVKDGYVAEGSAPKGAKNEPIDPATNLPVSDAKVYEENEGSVADALGQEIDVVGEGTPDAEEVQKAGGPEDRAKRASSKRSGAKKSSARRSPRT